MADSPQITARKTYAALIREARLAGWARVRGEIRPDGSIYIDAVMIEENAADDFLSGNLKMGK